MTVDGSGRDSVWITRGRSLLLLPILVFVLSGCAGNAAVDQVEPQMEAPSAEGLETDTSLKRAIPGVPADFRERTEKFGRVMDDWSEVAASVVFDTADLAGLQGVESIVVDDTEPGRDASDAKIPEQERWVVVFLADGSVVSRGPEGWESDRALVESEMRETGSKLWKQSVDLDGVVGIAWSAGVYESELDGQAYTLEVPNSLVAWSVDSITTTVRNERMPYEELLPVVHQIRRAQAELR